MLLLLCLTSCKKEFLEEKSSKALLVPTTFSDFQALMDNYRIMNSHAPGLSLIATDEFMLNDAVWARLSTATQRNSYIWASDLAEGEVIYDWNVPYTAVFYSNVVIEGLGKMGDDEQSKPEWKKIKGSALFFRASAFFHLSQSFCKQFDQNAEIELGIPLPLNPDVNISYDRGTLKDTYDRILNDLQEAYNLLPDVDITKNRPTKKSTALLLSRVYLTMGQYSDALKWADLCIAKSPSLIDYNLLDQSVFYPFARTLPNGNDEVLLLMNNISYSFWGTSTTIVSDDLYTLYKDDDLRKKIYFYKSAIGENLNKNYFALSLPEAYLISAECSARLNDLPASLSKLNTLLKYRMDKRTYIPLSISDKDLLLKIIIEERRKEMACRGVRWYDLKRFNKEQGLQTTLKRTVNGRLYELLPNDKRYVYPIPDDEMRRHNLIQNER